MAIIIVGCMRNGTSIVANILANNGMYVGDRDGLDWRGIKDPEGIWENLDFVKINNRVIEARGGHWVDALRVWHTRYYEWHKILNEPPYSNKLISKAIDLTQTLQDQAKNQVWGWKDPRNSLVLPFWLHILREINEPIKLIWAIRNPYESISSMQSLGYASQSGWHQFWNVWHAYNQTLLDFLSNSADFPVLVTHYEDWFSENEQNMDAKLLNLLDFAELPTDETTISNAKGRIKPNLYRHKKDDAKTNQLYEQILEFEENLVNGI